MKKLADPASRSLGSVGMAGIPDVLGRDRMVARKRNVTRIRALNDEMRMGGIGGSSDTSRWVLTTGVMALGPAKVRDALRRVSDFEEFDSDNDPHGEHDFGAFELAGERLFWKIDYYDQSLMAGSEDPADKDATSRILTIMLASEY